MLKRSMFDFNFLAKKQQDFHGQAVKKILKGFSLKDRWNLKSLLLSDEVRDAVKINLENNAQKETPENISKSLEDIVSNAQLLSIYQSGLGV